MTKNVVFECSKQVIQSVRHAHISVILNMQCLFVLGAHPAFRPNELINMPSCCVCPQFTRNASSPSILIQFQFCLVCLKELGPVH